MLQSAHFHWPVLDEKQKEDLENKYGYVHNYCQQALEFRFLFLFRNTLTSVSSFRMKTITLEPMQAILIGSGQLHTFQRIDQSTKMHWSIAWDFVNCSPVPEKLRIPVLSKSILYAMDQHDKSLVPPFNEMCTEDITLIRQIIVEAATVHRNIPDHYVLPFLQIVKEEVLFVKHLKSIGMEIPVLSILHGTQKNTDAYGRHRCMQCFRSLCNTIVSVKDAPESCLCHTCCVTTKKKKTKNRKKAKYEVSIDFLVKDCKVEMHFMSLTFMHQKVSELGLRSNDESNSGLAATGLLPDFIKEEVKSTLNLFLSIGMHLKFN
jgi:hypothetical protein